MTLPTTLTLVRHGQSEANVIQKLQKEKQLPVPPEGFYDRHDSNMRLTAEGVKQAVQAGEWLREHGPAFDRFYVSPHTRTCETAAHLHLNGDWRAEDRIRERDWGEVMSGTELSEASSHNKQLSAWYWKPQAGESMATGVRLRFESIMTSLYRKENTSHAIMVTHGELIRTAQFVIERMTPSNWTKMDNDPAYTVRNTMIIQYTKVNPHNSDEISSHYRWRRAICPWDESLSWDNGQWVDVSIKKFSDAELLQSVHAYERLL